MSPDIATAISSLEDFADEPIDPSWIVAGAPQARVRHLSAGSAERTRVAVWECTAGEFDWHYAVDEAVHLLVGEAQLRGADGVSRTVRAGDVVLFHAGSSVHWVVPDYVKKLAVLHDVRSPLRRRAHALLGWLRGRRRPRR